MSEYDTFDGIRHDDEAYQSARDWEVIINRNLGTHDRVWSEDKNYTPEENQARQAHLENTEWVIVSISECAASSVGICAWWNGKSWGNFDPAQKYSYTDMKTYGLPISKGNDAVWYPMQNRE